MKYLTTKEYMAMSWKARKLYFLERYAEDAERWQEEHDDRKLFSNIYEKLVEAVESLPEEPNLTVCVAMNDYISKDEATLDAIREHFRGR